MREPYTIPPGAQARLRLLATTDLHMHLTAYDYYADRADISVGLVRTAGLIHTARNEAEQSGALTLLFDNGDSLQGTPMGDLAVQSPDQPHPLMQAFDHLRYDALGLGNHDFNFGLDPLLAALRYAPCPVVCSNLRTRDGQALPGIVPSAVLDRHVHTQGGDQPVRIGILSVLPPQTVKWDEHLLHENIAVDDMTTAARHWITHLKQAGCDVVVALAHSGLDDTPEQKGMENAVVPLAALAGLDAVIAGHTHLLLPGPAHTGLEHVNAGTGDVRGKPVVMAGTAGSHLGVIDLSLKANSQGRWRVAGFDCALRPISLRDTNGALVSTTEQDRQLSALLAPAHAATRSLMHQPVGHTDQPLHSYFTFFAPDRALALVAAAQAAALRAVLAGTDLGDLPLLSAAAPCKFGARSGPLSYTDVPAGNVSLRHAADLHVFPNELRAVIITGRQILDWLEQSASLFHQIAPGSQNTPLTDPMVPGHDFDVLHGLTWQIDLSCASRFGPEDAAGRRIGDVRLSDGSPITPDQRFVVALNNFRAGGGGDFMTLRDAEPLAVPPMNIREIICDYLSGALEPDPLANCLPAWRFKPMPATSVTVQTGPGAAAYLDELAGRNVKVAGPGADGFLRLTLRL
jgi:2',3'-cyclic-nucleotide 2'-phosphodiesterase / 3'-nucleotidase